MKTIIMARTALFAEREAKINKGDNDYYRRCVALINKFNMGEIIHNETGNPDIIYSLFKT